MVCWLSLMFFGWLVVFEVNRIMWLCVVWLSWCVVLCLKFSVRCSLVSVFLSGCLLVSVFRCILLMMVCFVVFFYLGLISIRCLFVCMIV